MLPLNCRMDMLQMLYQEPASTFWVTQSVSSIASVLSATTYVVLMRKVSLYTTLSTTFLLHNPCSDIDLKEKKVAYCFNEHLCSQLNYNGTWSLIGNVYFSSFSTYPLVLCVNFLVFSNGNLILVLFNSGVVHTIQSV